LHHHYLFGPLR